ncbi:TetR/AcrR family transcriptional regulator C-terminal domain-containing protein [Amycolatopsis sp. BJA-103]|uniref:TetR/AcrR family transcriptional regulator C-terminal domain-containing protein n=1 Tax=unclassified Amycolatopsis TaxID=2618356 RepID=UPI000C76093F|nr:TetR/AcrR family transcriptional regulator C-terminal domain-containing protein [Amycolatopsis sp. BJA-103]AUI63908.1 TetR family transcriptional regulator [Amycolatopsis sp. BJA-103]PNE15936.1 TetR family transcriptional regulator [Amycolatopsis sp. BJA-103]
MVVRRDGYVRAALELLDEVGLDGLSLRKLGEKLGVRGPALYTHFKSKQALLDQMAETMLDDNLAPLNDLAAMDDWAGWLTRRARTIRRTLLSYRDGARLHAGSRPTGRSAMTPLVKPLREAGFTEEDATHAILAVSRYTLGCAIDEQQHVEGDSAVDHAEDPAASFEYGLARLIAGLRADVDVAKPPDQDVA